MKAEEFLKDGMDRIEFRNQLIELVIGTSDNDGELIRLKNLSKSEILYYLEEQLEELKEELQNESTRDTIRWERSPFRYI